VSYLDKDKLKIVHSEFCKLSAENFDLFTQKGIFPLRVRWLRWKIAGHVLTTRIIFQFVDERYRIRERLRSRCERFSIRTLGENSDLYLKTNVLLLANIFENFCESYVASYGLDAAHYYTLLGFTWNAMLKHTRRFECSPTLIWSCSFNVIYAVISVKCSGRYTQVNNNACVRTTHFDDRHAGRMPIFARVVIWHEMRQLVDLLVIAVECKHLPHVIFEWLNRLTTDAFNVEYVE